MNDVFVNFDDDRRYRLAEIMQRFCHIRQVIILSCHWHSLDLCPAHGAHQIIVK